MNPFQKTTETERKRSEDLLRQSAEDYNATINAARECLKIEQFKKYREEFDRTAQALFQIFLQTPSSDVIIESIRVKLNAMALLGVDVLRIATLELRVVKPVEKPGEKKEHQ